MIYFPVKIVYLNIPGRENQAQIIITPRRAAKSALDFIMPECYNIANGGIMHTYTKELEKIIVEDLLPVYMEHYRLLGLPAPIKHINSKLLKAMKEKRKVCRLLERDSYD